MKIAIHQPNFIPWFPFFYKMAKSDKFIILTHVQFEKNGFQNRYRYSDGTWVTKSVSKGLHSIQYKKYADGNWLVDVNLAWIYLIADLLGLKGKISVEPDGNRMFKGSATERIASICKHFGATTYLTNETAKDKYLDEDLLKSHGIDIEYLVVPRNLNKHTFEIFHQYGIEGAKKFLK